MDQFIPNIEWGEGEGIWSPKNVHWTEINASVPEKFVHDCSSRFLLNLLGWDNLLVRRAKQNTNLMYKCINNLAPAYLCNLFAPRTLNYYFCNAKKKLMLPRPKTDYLKCSFSYSGTLLWNNLPVEIHTSNSLSFFKRSFHWWFSDQYSGTRQMCKAVFENF